MARPGSRRIRQGALAALSLGLLLGLAPQCGGELDVCAPTEARLGFFSKGDCLVTRASFFQGHEWLTWLGNQDLPEAQRFTASEARQIAEGNRRVDWPHELLIHLNNGVPAYVLALTEYTERPENQRFHFLLDDRNDTPSAHEQALQELERLTLQAAESWPSNRAAALAAIGRAQHLVQDSFSEAHALRDPDHAELPWCVRAIKAYIERHGDDDDDGEGPGGVLYHGAEDGEEGVTIGHVTPQDSLYRPGRDCHEPSDQAAVERCLSPSAIRARLASRDHLAAALRIVQARAEGAELRELVAAELGQLRQQHLELCP